MECIDEDVPLSDVLRVFEEITDRCDFFSIFEAVPYGDVLPTVTWTDLTDYNATLSENGLANIPQAELQSVLVSRVNRFKCNVTGVFMTQPNDTD